MQPNEWIPLLTLGANIGFSVVVAWYLLSRAIPQMQERFDRALSDQRLQFSTDMKSQREDHEKLMAAIVMRDSDNLKRVAEKIDHVMNTTSTIARSMDDIVQHLRGKI